MYYEIGLAHGIGRPTLLICRDASVIPFDIAAINHIVYGSITDLRDRLEARLVATLNLSVS